MDDKPVTSKELAAFLRLHRDNDVRVRIHNILVPIADAYYHGPADMIVIEPLDGADLRIATACCTDCANGDEK